MNTIKHPRKVNRCSGTVAVMLALVLAPRSPAQGTMTITFEGQPPGTAAATSSWSGSGMSFWNPYNPANLVLVGAGISGYPQDGSGYLQVTPGGTLGFDAATPAYFTPVSFDAAGYSSSGPGASLEAVGYKAMGVTVTNFFTVDSVASRQANSLPDFASFFFDSQFQNVYRVDILAGGWSLDNLVVNGIPEPSSGTLLLIGTLCFAGFRRVSRKRPHLLARQRPTLPAPDL